MSKRLIKNSAIYTFGGVLSRAIGFLLIPIYTSYLTVQEYGTLSLINLIIQLMSFIMLMGVSTACMRFYFDKESSEQEKQNLYGNGIIVLLFGPIVLLLITVPILYTLVQQSIIKIPFLPYIVLIILISTLTPIIMLLQGLLRIKEKPKQYLYFSVGFFLFQVLLILIALSGLGLGLKGQVYSQFIANFVFWLIALISLTRYTKIEFDYSVIKKLLKFGILLIPFFIFTWIASASGRFMLESYGDLFQVGILALAMQFAGILLLLANGIDNAMLPNFYRIANRENNSKQLGSFITKYYCLFAIISFFTIIISEPLVRMVANNAYYESIKFIPYIILSALIFIFNKPLIWCFTHSKKTALLSSIRVIMSIFMVVLLYITLELYKLGISGVILSTIVANSIMLIVMYRVSSLYLKIDLLSLRFAFFMSLVFVSIVCLSFPITNMSLIMSTLIRIAFTVFVSVVLLKTINFNVIDFIRSK